ncbi:hypothetical protein [Nocardia flavorosea]|uniref:Uncharacterized protein n=1 Tax=Nocardia flavorosea TaxID=53429 RepID=A0A846YCD1_9NOCA|nr:hypothetical protein [Nocardia flavorosea]NKY55420.1 hypothetical protein [Nocardia flavorosea]
MDSKTKVAGPLAAAGAVSLGLVFIGACGVGQEDTYVPPPPIHSGSQAVEQARYADPTATTVAQVLIPPSPTWRMAPEPPPRRTLPPEYQISVTSSAAASTGPGETTDSDETTRRATLSATPGELPIPEQDSAATSSPATEIEPAHSESPIPLPAPTGTEAAPPTSVVPGPTTTIEEPGDSETPVTPESPATTEPVGSETVPGTEAARTTSTPVAPESQQSMPFGLPADTTETGAPESGALVPTITIAPAIPPRFGG